MSLDFTRPVLLQPFNAVPLARTPWAGQGISKLLQEPPVGNKAWPRLGECWEFSCDPQYPSRVATTQARLDRAIAAQPQAALSVQQFERHGAYCQLLVKLINAARPLSVQLHPDLSIAAPLAGKWESWLVLAAAKDSVAYVGFNTALIRTQLREEITAGTLAAHLAAVNLQAGTYLEIPPHTVHALGAGAVVLEVQYLLQGRGGETLRLWDWGHKYNDRGEFDLQHGKARPLALTRALPLIEAAAQQRDVLHARILSSPQKIFAAAGVDIVQCSDNLYYRLLTLTTTAASKFRLSIAAGYGIMLCWRGAWRVAQAQITGYQPLFLPAALGKMEIEAEKGSQAVLIVPQGAEVSFRLD